MDYEETIADLLRPVDFDPTRLSPEARAEVRLLAQKAGIELPWPGRILASHRGAERLDHEATSAEPRR